MSDELVNEAAELQFEDEQDDEIIVSDEVPEPEPTPDPEKEQLRQQLELMQAQLAEVSTKSSEAQALKEGISALGEKLSPSEPKQQQQPWESDEDFAKRVKDEFYDDPVKVLNEFAMRKIGPELQRLAAANEKTWKREILRDPRRKDTFELYKDEIEKEYQNVPVQERYTDPDAIVRVHDLVVSRHLDEIIESRVNERVQQGTGQQATQAPTRRVPTYSESGGVTPSASSMQRTPKRTLTTAEAAWASKRGMIREKAYEFFQRNPDVKKIVNTQGGR